MDAHGCDPALLKDASELAGLFEALIVALELRVVGAPQWHSFPGAGGVTGLALLAESHLALHTFPEHGFAALNVYCCRRRAEPDFQTLIARHLGQSARAQVRVVTRGPEAGT